MTLVRIKQKFKKTKLGRGLRHIRNYLWRAKLEDERWRKEDPIGYHRLHDRLSFD